VESSGIAYNTIMYKIVIDTNIFISALRSSKGASFRLLSMVGTEKFDFCISVPLILEFEAVAKRDASSFGLDSSESDDILDYLCLSGNKRHLFYLWRPLLKDPKDDMVLELAVESESHWIITFNKRDFRGCETFGINLATPKEFLHLIGEV
jgi:putative PIN family toxin of toxin-antitoxin system